MLVFGASRTAEAEDHGRGTFFFDNSPPLPPNIFCGDGQMITIPRQPFGSRWRPTTMIDSGWEPTSI